MTVRAEPCPDCGGSREVRIGHHDRPDTVQPCGNQVHFLEAELANMQPGKPMGRITFPTPASAPRKMTDPEIDALLKHVDDMIARGVRLSPRTSAELVDAFRQLRAQRDLAKLSITCD